MELKEVILFSTALLAIVNPLGSAVLVTATAFGLLGRGIGGLLPGLAK